MGHISAPEHDLLLVSYGFAPWGSPASFRATKLAASALEDGWRVRVVCAAESSAHVADDPSLATTVGGAEVLRVSDGTDYRARPLVANTLGHRFVRGLDRLMGAGMHKWSNAAHDAALARWNDSAPAWVVATAPPGAVVELGARLAACWNAKLILDFRDPPWDGMFGRERLAELGEQATKLVLNTPLAAREFRSRFPSLSDRCQALTNGIDGLLTRSSNETTSLKRRPLVRYLGGVYPDVERFAAELVQATVDWDFEVYGFAEVKRRGTISRLKQSGARVLNPVPSARVVPIMSDADAVLVPLPAGYDFRTPYKAYEAVASGAAVLPFGRSRATQEQLDGVPGVFWADNGAGSLRHALEQCRAYDRGNGWPARRAWLQGKDWGTIFRSMLEVAPRFPPPDRSQIL